MRSTFILSVLLVLTVTWAKADSNEITSSQALDRAQQSVQNLHDAIEKLKHPPDYAGETFLNAFMLEKAADECVTRKELMRAKVFYEHSMTGLGELSVRRPEWQTKIVLFRMKSLNHKIKRIALQTEDSQKSIPLAPEFKSTDPDKRTPDGW